MSIRARAIMPLRQYFYYFCINKQIVLILSSAHLLHFAHHLARLLKLLEESIEFHTVHSRSLGNTVLTASVEQRRISALCGCHGVDDSFNRFECVV